MADPWVCAIMLTRDRPEMAKRAVECFKEQTYQNKTLLVWDTGKEKALYLDGTVDLIHTERRTNHPGVTIGALRNMACLDVSTGPLPLIDILIHWDDDDWSHPNRIAEQVALLQSSGKECVGYSDLLFWKTPEAIREPWEPPNEHECWMYSHPPVSYLPGTSLCYWRKTWERRPFPDRMRGEDEHWLFDVDSLGVSSIVNGEPRMIATLHASNTSSRVCENTAHWKRVPEWDEYCSKFV